MPVLSRRRTIVRGSDPILAPLFGRQEEITEITRLLAQPDCRLVTVFGPGGVGKTRLSQEIAVRSQESFHHGAAFVPLQPVSVPEAFPTAIAGALGLALSGAQEPIVQLASQLSELEMLLVLDNFEHLLPAVSQLVQLLSMLPGIKFLVTSREVLSLQQEWLYRLEGLQVPESATDDNLADYSAVQLFSQHARRVQQNFDLSAEADAVVQICQQLEGLPLALEMAASWRRSLQSAEIARALDNSQDILATQMQDVPERHRSMQAVFAQSWQYLNRAEQDAYRRLAVFRSSFSAEAAQAVAGADILLLTALVDKSLLRRDTYGRFQIHALLQQFARDQLIQNPDLAREIQLQHCRYYLGFLAARRDALLFVSAEAALAEVRLEFDNIQLAWEYAIEQSLVPELCQANVVLDSFYQTQSRFLEGRQVMERAVFHVSGLPPGKDNRKLLAELLMSQNWFAIRLGRFVEAQQLCERAWKIYADGQIPIARIFGGDPRSAMVTLHNLRGKYVQAIQLGEELLHACLERDDPANLAFAHYVLSFAHLATGEFEQARMHGQRACELTRSTGDRWFLAYPLIEWGSAERALGNYTAARRLYQESYDLRKQFDDQEGMALALSHLGRVAILEHRYQEAEQLYQESAGIYWRINDRGGLANATNGLGIVACKYHHSRKAAEYFQQALGISVAIDFVPLTLNILVCVGELMLATGDLRLAKPVLEAIYHHPASEQEVRLRAAELLEMGDAADFGSSLQNVARDGPKNSGHRLAEAVQLCRQYLDVTRSEPDPRGDAVAPDQGRRKAHQPGAAKAAGKADQPDLIEPLTERELEVLALIAAGYTNRGIAETLVLSTGTVKWYTSQIYQKLNVSNRTQAVAAAHARDLLPSD